MARKLFRAALWGVKGVLLLVTVATLFVWPCSFNQQGTIERRLRSESGDWTNDFKVTGGWGEGRVGISYSIDHYKTATIDVGHPSEDDEPQNGWKLRSGEFAWIIFERGWGFLSDSAYEPHPTYGPFYNWSEGDNEFVSRGATLPCWLLALTSGLWPLTSLAMLVRRRRKARRLRLTGCCHHCGYDLRAASSDPEARCPECGTVRPAAS